MNVKNKDLLVGMVLMIVSSISTSIGQLMWKLSANNENLLFYFLGFLFYGVGAMLMIIAFKYGELSILHPIMSFGYVISIFFSIIILHESITLNRFIGIGLIVLGMFFLGRSGMKGEE